jgi:hypothetical protein
MADAQGILDLLQKAGVLGFALAAIVGGYRGIYLWRWTHEAIVAERDRQYAELLRQRDAHYAETVQRLNVDLATYRNDLLAEREMTQRLLGVNERIAAVTERTATRREGAPDA